MSCGGCGFTCTVRILDTVTSSDIAVNLVVLYTHERAVKSYGRNVHSQKLGTNQGPERKHACELKFLHVDQEWL
jgi:hypothetical protein